VEAVEAEWAALAAEAVVEVVEEAAAASRRRERSRHRPQILSQLQCAGVEHLQRHQLWATVRQPDSDAQYRTGLYGPGSRFDKSTSLARGLGASPTSSAARRIFFQAAFTF